MGRRLLNVANVVMRTAEPNSHNMTPTFNATKNLAVMLGKTDAKPREITLVPAAAAADKDIYQLIERNNLRVASSYTDTLRSAMDTVYYSGVELIRNLQDSLAGHETAVAFLNWYQEAYSPINVIRFLVPLIYLVQPWAAFRLAFGVAVTGNLCSIMKWSLRGIRPYWYNFHHTVDGLTPQPLSVMPFTCEASYGTPSGYVANSAVTAVILLFAIHRATRPRTGLKRAIFVVAAVLAGGSIWLMWIARMHSAQSYSFQMTLGLILGAAVGATTSLLPWKEAQVRQIIAIPPSLLAWFYISRQTLISTSTLLNVPMDDLVHITQAACSSGAVTGKNVQGTISSNEMLLWANASLLAGLVIVLDSVKRYQLSARSKSAVVVTVLVFELLVAKPLWNMTDWVSVVAPMQLTLLLFWFLPAVIFHITRAKEE